MKIIIDNKIPYIKGIFEPFAEVIYAAGKDMNKDIVKDVDVLITRTRTICDAKLLSGSKTRFIATATIGYDHIDQDYCKQNDIIWKNAPGCNADAVVQYVFAAIFQLVGGKYKDLTLGVVGVGNVGSRVANFAEKLGMKVLRNDPPRAEKEGYESFSSLETIQKEADIITFHTPLSKNGNYPTFHLCDNEFLETLTKKPIIINAARGEVTDSMALLKAKKAEIISHLVLDCWENEPILDTELLKQTDIATFHIAGYSMEGKANATSMVVQAVSRIFNLSLNHWKVDLPKNPNTEFVNLPIMEQVRLSYDIMNDDQLLRKNPTAFEKLRENYNYRRQPLCFSL